MGYYLTESYSHSQMQKIDVDGTLRTFKLVIPPDTSKKSSLIIALHGFSGNARTIEMVSGLTEYAKKYNFFVAYPNGYGTNSSVFFSWNAEFCCGNAQSNNSNDVLFIRSLIQYISDSYNINKTFITGISNGAMMVNKIGIELGNIISGIIVVAGAIGTTYPRQFRFDLSDLPLDVMIFHGQKDTFIPFKGDKGVKDDPNQFLPVSEEVDYWVRVNKCIKIPKKELLSDGQVIKETYISPETDKKVIVYILKEGTHTWPGGKKGLPTAGEPLSKDVCDASQILVDYFIRNID